MNSTAYSLPRPTQPNQPLASMYTPEQTDEIIATLTLNRLQGLSHSQAIGLIDHYGSACAALADDAPINPAWAILQHDVSGLRMARDRALREFDFCQEHHIRIIPTTAEDYPRRLLLGKRDERPLQLFYCGSGNLDRRHIISIVGTRHITEYGKIMCEKLLHELAEIIPDALIISGLAYGVDIHAHRAALVNNLDTMAVLAHGLDRIYPSKHRDTAEQMTQHGGLLTEYFTNTVPDKGRFICRNRIVAGMSSATIVVESASHGGSLVTARLAREYGRCVMAVPGRDTDVYSAGCNNLIRDGYATLITCGADIVRLLGWGQTALSSKPEPTLFKVLDEREQCIVDALEKVDYLTMDQLALQTQLSVSELADALFQLEDEDYVKRLPGNRYRMRR